MLKWRFLTGDRSPTVKNLLQKAKMRERSQDKKLQKVIKERDALRKQLACKVQQAYIFGVWHKNVYSVSQTYTYSKWEVKWYTWLVKLEEVVNLLIVACWLSVVKRMETPDSSIIIFTTTSSLTYPGSTLNHLIVTT